MGPVRCEWADSSEAMRQYHDEEWGRPSRDDRHLFEMVLLESAQAGLSWATILAKREGYRAAFEGFEPERVAAFDDRRVEALLQERGIVRNRAKIRSAIGNARAFLAIAGERQSFANYLWEWVADQPIVNAPTSSAEVPAHSPLSDAVSRDLRRRGFSFVGTTMVYSYLQAVGIVDDHVIGCEVSWRPLRRGAATKESRVDR